MNRKTESRSIVFLFLSLFVACGLMTGLDFRGSLDIQLHDTFVLIGKVQVLIVAAVVVSIAYLLTFGLKKLAKLNHAIRIASTVTASLLALCFMAVLIPLIGILYTSPGPYALIYGASTFVLSLAIFLVFRAYEIWRTQPTIG